MPWWIAFKASKFFKPVTIGFAILAVLVVVFALGRCSDDGDDVAAQAEQTNRSGEAAADAADMAIDTLEDRQITDAAVDAAVIKATQEIEDAPTVDAVRAVVVGSLCGKPAHRNDPACRVQPPNP